MDDILVYINGSEKKHWEAVRSVLRKLDKAGLFLDINKCDILEHKVKYLRFILMQETV